MLLFISELVIVCYLGKIKLIMPRKWLKYSLVASVCFTVNSVVMVSIIKRVGLYSAMYYPFGGLGLALVFAMYYKGIHTNVNVIDEDSEDEEYDTVKEEQTEAEAAAAAVADDPDSEDEWWTGSRHGRKRQGASNDLSRVQPWMWRRIGITRPMGQRLRSRAR